MRQEFTEGLPIQLCLSNPRFISKAIEVTAEASSSRYDIKNRTRLLVRFSVTVKKNKTFFSTDREATALPDGTSFRQTGKKPSCPRVHQNARGDPGQ